MQEGCPNACRYRSPFETFLQAFLLVRLEELVSRSLFALRLRRTDARKGIATP